MRSMSRTPLRIFAFINHAIIWLSSLIVVGILSYFLSKFDSASHSTHIVYQEVIACITLAFWTVGTFLPLISRYGGHMWPVNLLFSYLWLTSFIFSAQDWSLGRCRLVGFGFDKCGLKRTVIAFNFLAFFFLLMNTIVENLLYREHRNESVNAASADHRKRPGTDNTAASSTV